MPKITRIQIGSVYLKEVEHRKWRASWTDPITKKWIRRILPAAAFREAEKQAQEINKELAAGKGFGGRLRGTVGHTVREAIHEAVKHTDANDRTRRDYLNRANPFLEYLAAHYKGIAVWSEVTEQILENYLEYCRKQDIAHDTIRMRLYVLRLTSSYMTRTYPDQYRHVTMALKLKRKDPPRSELEANDAILSPAQIRDLISWLKESEPMVYMWAMLQGLCGLRLLEATYIREQDFDPEAMTITITANSAHKPKNRHSYRTIPVCPAMTSAMCRWIESLKVRHHEGFLFMPSRGIRGRTRAKSQEARAGALTRDYISHIWRDVLIRAKSSGKDFPKRFVPRKLRASFVTAMRTAGADLEVLQAYIGHAPTNILSAYYDHISMDRFLAISRLSQEMFEATGALKKTSKEAIINNFLPH